MTRPPSIYSKQNPFLAKVTHRSPLCKPGSKKNTMHIVLDLDGSDIRYETGDSIAIFPEHDPQLVERTLRAMKAKGNEVFIDKSEASHLLTDFLTRKANITEVSRKFLSELMQRQTNSQKKQELEALLHEDSKLHLKAFLGHFELWEILEQHPEVTFDPSEICRLLMPLLPRFYSIASSQHVVGNEVHFTIALVDYVNPAGSSRAGVCTHYLCRQAPLNEAVVPIYLQPHHGFTLPEDPSTPLIMIGPGTGVAPFRAFMQERIAKNAPGKNWLFFGEWSRSHNFLYEEFWTPLANQGSLQLDLAFSRDQSEKIYVQHRMLEKARELYKWIAEGAIVYVCGDAKKMARDVEATLLTIFQEQGGLSPEESNTYLKKMRQDKRYLKDVY